MALFCIDFDGTIFDGHSHNRIIELHLKTPEEQWAFVKSVPPVGPSGIWRDTIKQILQDGHDIAIVSFNAYGYIIPKYLAECVGLTDQEVAKIQIISTMPTNIAAPNKNEHIKQAQHKHSGKYNTQNSILIDDSENNINAAKQFEVCHHVTLASKQIDYFSSISQLSRELKVILNDQSINSVARP
jgi:hypothetical protein